MASLIRRAGANVLRTIARTLDPSAPTNAIDLFAKDVPALNGQPQMFVRSSDFARQISGTECNIWDRPLTPSAYDDEFDSTVLDPAWQIVASDWVTPAAWDQGGISPFETGNDLPRYELHTDRRPSWLMIQPLGNNTVARVRKPFAFAGDFSVWVRNSFNVRVGATNNRNPSVYLSLTSDPWDDNNSIVIKSGTNTVNDIDAEFYRVSSGTTTRIGITRNIVVGSVAGLQPIEVVGIQYRAPNTFDGWAIGASGHAIWLGSTTLAITPGFVGLSFHAVSGSTPGYMISGVDFVRFVEGTVFLP